MVAANVRYGLTSAPGIRFSKRRLMGEPPTSRKPHVRLSRPQAITVGAKVAAWYRLYELMVGAKK